MDVYDERHPQVKKSLGELTLLFEISQLLDSSLDLREVVGPVLEAIHRHTKIIRGAITLFNRETGEIMIETATGLSAYQKKKGRYRVGEGITGKVVETGKPIIVPRVSQEPLFLDKTGARRDSSDSDVSFVCVPIKIGNEVVGTLSTDSAYSDEVSLEEEVRLLSIIASLVSQAVKIRQEALEEQQRLMAENIRLQEELKDRFRPGNIIGNSSAMQEVFKLVAQVVECGGQDLSNPFSLAAGDCGHLENRFRSRSGCRYIQPSAIQGILDIQDVGLPDRVLPGKGQGMSLGFFQGGFFVGHILNRT